MLSLGLFLFLFSFIITFLLFPVLIPRLKKAGILGKDMHKLPPIQLPEMGGLGVVSGFCAGIIIAVGAKIFFNDSFSVDVVSLLAVLASVLMISLIGVFDDLFGVKKWIKALLPAFAALPLMAIKAGHTVMKIPFWGPVDFGLVYSFLLIPLGVTGAANAINMLAGFNGIELGMSAAAIFALAAIAYFAGSMTSFVILIVALGAIFAALRFNWYPAKVLIGDVGTLSIGAIIASSVIIGNFETAGLIIMAPYFVDFIFKAKNGFPKSFGIYNDGKLHCPRSGPVGFGQWIMKVTGGITERRLVLLLILIEALFGGAAILVYAYTLLL